MHPTTFERAFESFDRALAVGDAAALQGLITETVYDIGTSDIPYPQHRADNTIRYQLRELSTCGLVGTRDRLFDISFVFGTVAEKSAGEKRLAVLPQQGMWIYLEPRSGVAEALDRCRAGRDFAFKTIVIAPVGKEWRVVAWNMISIAPPDPPGF